MGTNKKKYTSPYIIFGTLAAIIVLTFMFYLNRLDLPYFISYLLAINISVFLFYGYDKLIAGSTLLRIPEKILHSIAILGGSPSALLAQKLFRHKTAKKSFLIIYWGIVIIQIAIILKLYVF